MTDSALPYKRVLLKLSGEALMGNSDGGIDPPILREFASQIQETVQLGVQIGLVIGGGNFFRGAGLQEAGMDRVTGDYMGMLATVMNALAMRDALRSQGTKAVVMSALSIQAACEPWSRDRALRYLEEGYVVLFAAGTGNPYFTTDSAASLRAIETESDIMFKATKVDGVYSADPVKDPSAQRFNRLTYDEALARKLTVMDATAIVLCRDNNMPLMVFNIHERGNLVRAVRGEMIGTLVEQGAGG